MATWGGARAGAGRPKSDNDNRSRRRVVTIPAEPKKIESAGLDINAMMRMVEASQDHARRVTRTPENNPFRLPEFPKQALPPKGQQMAMDEFPGFQDAGSAWLAGGILNSIAAEGLLFPGYAYLSELTQRPEYRIVSETIADDATRKWINFEVTGDEDDPKAQQRKKDAGDDPDERDKRLKDKGKTDKVKALNDYLTKLEARNQFFALCRDSGFFGRTHLYLGIGGEDVFNNYDELKIPIGDGRSDASKAKVSPDNPLTELRTIEPIWTYPMAYNASNPLSPDWYNPQQWYVLGREIHVSRLLPFIDRPVPDMLKPAYSFGGLSLSQIIQPYVDIWLQTRQAVADLIRNFSVMVLMTDLQALLQPGGAQSLIARAVLSNALRDNQGLQVLNKATEDFKNVSASLAGLDGLQAQAQEHIASIARLPLVKFTGLQPKGLNSSAEGEIAVYDDTIGAYQNRSIRPHLTTVVNFAQLSLWGEVDPEITFEFEKLREISRKEQSEKEKDDATRDQTYVDVGALSPAEVRQRIVNDPDLPYTALDPDDLPDLEQEEEEGLQPEGGRPNPVAEGGASGEERGGAADGIVPFGADEWNESDHPRGQPGNAGQFGSGGGGKSSSSQATTEKKGSNGAASKLYQAPTKSADDIIAAVPGATAAIAKTKEKLATLIPTDAPVSKGGFKNPDGTYTPERQAVHEAIVDRIFNPEAVARALPDEGEKPVLTILGGRGGSGKSWLTKPGAGPVDVSKAILLDADGIKGMLPGYEGWNAAQFHEESTDILNLADRRAAALGVNTIHDATLKSEAGSAMRIAAYEAEGYQLAGYYMYASPEVATERAMKRFSKGGTFSGRFVPPEIVLGNVNNEKNFDNLSGGMIRWAIYENNTAAGPQLVAKSEDR